MRYIDEHLAKIEADSAIDSRSDAYNSLRELGLADFGEVLINMPDSRFSKISGLLPAFASEEVQRNWTGSSGESSLIQSLNFVRSIAANYAHLADKDLSEKKILDFGCGYGRHLRLFSYFSDNVFGVDPWDESIRHCKEAGIDNVALSEYLPKTLPVPKDYDLAYAYSVFTHLSERATIACLKTLRQHVKLGGILCITIRPVEYWRVDRPDWSEAKHAQIERQHEVGFVFDPHLRAAVDNDVTYGDTSMSLDWLKTQCGQMNWKVEAVDRSIDDPIQRFVFLRAI